MKKQKFKAMFHIEIKNDILFATKDIEDTSVSEAIETIYNNSSGWIAKLNWNGYIIPLFGFTVGDIYSNIINILNSIKHGEKNFTENFLDSSFTARWECYLENNDIKITAFWFDVASIEKDTPKEILKNTSNVVILEQKEFVLFWSRLLVKIKKDLIATGYDDSLEGFEYLNMYAI